MLFRSKKKGQNVIHGAIKEVSLVLAGANPGAFIDSIIKHGEESDEEAIIYTGEALSLYHADDETPEIKIEHKEEQMKNDNDLNLEHAEDEETVSDVFETLSEKQKTVVYALIGQALEEAAGSDDDKDSKGGKENMKHNVFDNDNDDQGDVLSHSEMQSVFDDARRYGSLKDSVIQHGIEDIEYLFPDAQNVTATPTIISRDMGWVQKVMKGVHNTPFSRIKSLFADITEDDARAKGYIKGKLKKEEIGRAHV